jgi:hypothetical protein
MRPYCLFFLGFFPICALVLLGIWNPCRRQTVLAVLRSRVCDGLLFFPAAALFLAKIARLGPADFGEHKFFLLGFFGLLALAVFWKNFGFLAVRGLAILLLLWANAVLQALLGNFAPPWLLAKAVAHGTVVLALVLTFWPYLLRDWLLRRAKD